LIRPNSSVAEGLKKYIFIASRQPAGRKVHELIANQEWFNQTFVESIFSINDNLIQYEDIHMLTQRFFDDPRTTSWIIRALVMRWDSKRYPNLNIFNLFKLLDEMDKESFDAYVKPAIGFHRQWGFDGTNLWTVEDLCAQIGGDVSEDIPLPIKELIVHLLDIPGSSGSYPAFRIFQKYTVEHPNHALDLLIRHTDARNIGVQSQVWRLLAQINHSVGIPNPLLEKARKRLDEIDRSTPARDISSSNQEEYLDVLERELRRLWEE
jgi:hypothetical protein